MEPGHGLDRPVYDVGGESLSILDLLRRFADPELQAGRVPRISDLHLRVGEPARYRQDEEVVPLEGAAPLTLEVVQALLFPLLSRDKIGVLSAAAAEDVDASFDLEEEQLSFRINAFRDRDGLACAIRVLPRLVPAVEDIGFPRDAIWQEIVERRQGLVITCGVTGSGKSTTIASIIARINETRQVRVITLEDPIEYVIRSDRAMVSQREVGRHIHSFSAGLRSALREDPDVILVGEMRDPETTALALSAAETGHLVLSTLHTKDTRGAITRILDMFPTERSRELATQLSFSLTHVLGQKLVRRADGGGRRLVMEVLKNISAVANLIRSGNLHQLYSCLETRRREGLSSLEHHLAELVRSGEVEAVEAERAANDPKALAASMAP